MALFAHKFIPGALDDSTLEVNNEMGRIKDEGVSKDKLYQGADVNMLTDTGVADTPLPNRLIGLTLNAVTFADSGNDDLTLGEVAVATGNVVEGIIPDIDTFTGFRITGVINASGGVLLVTVAQEADITINGQGKRLSIVDGGYCVLMEIDDDSFAIVDASGVSLVAFA